MQLSAISVEPWRPVFAVIPPKAEGRELVTDSAGQLFRVSAAGAEFRVTLLKADGGGFFRTLSGQLRKLRIEVGERPDEHRAVAGGPGVFEIRGDAGA